MLFHGIGFQPVVFLCLRQAGSLSHDLFTACSRYWRKEALAEPVAPRDSVVRATASLIFRRIPFHQEVDLRVADFLETEALVQVHGRIVMLDVNPHDFPSVRCFV